MPLNDPLVATIVVRASDHFPSFGGGIERGQRTPITAATKDKPPTFAAGVDIEQVVRFVLEQAE